MRILAPHNERVLLNCSSMSIKQMIFGRRFLPQGSQQLRGFSECSVKGILGQARKSENRLETTDRGVMIG